MYLFGEKKDFWFLILSLMTGLVLASFYSMTYKAHYDIHQMLERAHQWVEYGNLICYGNASSAGMGKVPGCLSSLLVGLPMMLWNSPYAALFFLVLTQGLALFLISSVFKEYFKKSSVLIFIFVFWMSPWRLSEVYLWNPSYLFLAIAMHFFSAHKLRQKSHFFYTLIHVLSLFFAFQIHNSSIILAFISALLFWKKALKVHIPGVVLGGLLGLGSLAPYIVALINNPEISPEIREDKYFLFRGLLYIFPMLKAVWYWIRFSGAVFPKRIFQLIEFSWLGEGVLQVIISYLWIAVKYGVAIVSVIFSFKANKYFVKRYRPLVRVWKYRYQPNDWLPLYTVLTFMAVILAAAISPIDLIFWHLIIVYPIAHIPIFYFLEGNSNKWPIRKLVIACFFYFTVYNIFCVLGSDRFSIKENPHKDYIKRYYSTEH